LPAGGDVIIDSAWTKGQAISPLMSSAAAKKVRPKYLSLPALLFEIRLPLPGWISILHRISGLLLFFPLAAWLLYLLDTSLVSQQGFDKVRNEYLQLPVVKLALVVFIWAYCHHFCAGIRFLFLDLDKGLDLRIARLTSALVLVTSLVLTAFFAVKIW
jgi:succinate dehydrogenase / fumarate reductase cytochrome b subunit